MTPPAANPPAASSLARVLFGALVTVLAHAAVVGGAFLAGRIAEPSPGGGALGLAVGWLLGPAAAGVLTLTQAGSAN